MDVYIWIAVLVLVVLGVGGTYLDFRRKHPQRVKGQGDHHPHSASKSSADAQRLQNGGGAGPGAIGGGSDFGP